MPCNASDTKDVSAVVEVCLVFTWHFPNQAIILAFANYATWKVRWSLAYHLCKYCRQSRLPKNYTNQYVCKEILFKNRDSFYFSYRTALVLVRLFGSLQGSGGSAHTALTEQSKTKPAKCEHTLNGNFTSRTLF